LISSKYPLFKKQNQKLLLELQSVRTEACFEKKRFILEEKKQSAVNKLSTRNEEWKKKVVYELTA
jgi:hypothetical protein